MITSGTSIIAEPMPACAFSITRQSGCALRQAWNTLSAIMLVARSEGPPSASSACALAVSTVIAPVSSSSECVLPSMTTCRRGKSVTRLPCSSVLKPSANRRSADEGFQSPASRRNRRAG